MVFWTFWLHLHVKEQTFSDTHFRVAASSFEWHFRVAAHRNLSLFLVTLYNISGYDDRLQQMNRSDRNRIRT